VVVPAGFKIDIAWELDNLERIAYKNYELFKISKGGDNPDEFRKTLRQNSILYTSPNICSDRVNDYFIEQTTQQDAQQTTSSNEVASNYREGFFQYRILATYNYLAYSFQGISITPLPDVTNFGFIAERITNDHERLIFVVFRGTQELEEWFVNFQFKQKRFLLTKPEDDKDDYPQRVSLGFNKIYTGYRPGLLHGENLFDVNSYSRYIDEEARKRSEKRYRDEHKLYNNESIFESVKKTINNVFTEGKKPENIYIAGHSLGAVLATISSLHISRLLRDIEPEGKTKVSLYTFASPRVGNKAFAEECSKSFTTYRIVNTKDIVPEVPFAAFKLLALTLILSYEVA